MQVTDSMSCIEQLRALYAAYLAAVTGQVRVITRFNDRWSEYARPEPKLIQELYMTLYVQCPAASAAGLPNLNPNSKVQRGAPARGVQSWPRL